MIIKTEQSEIQNYLADASNTNGFCDAVYFPENTNEIKQILKKANGEKLDVTVCGNRTGLTGAAVPKGGIVISTEKLNTIIEINIEEKYAVVEPGVMLSDFISIIKDDNLFYPPDPTELNCFIGGTVATNASGANTFKFGATRNFVIGLEVILANGETLNLERGKAFARENQLEIKSGERSIYKFDIPDIVKTEVKNASGFYLKRNMDAIDLFIGSEGTLGIFTKIKLKLLEMPEGFLSAIIFFNTEDDALGFITKAREDSKFSANGEKGFVDALALEYFDFYSLKFLKIDYPNIPGDAQAAVWFEQELTSENEVHVTELWIRIIEDHNGNLNNSWMAANEKERNELEKFRHSISAKVNDYISSRSLRKLGTDVAVPGNKFINFYKQIKSEVEKNNLDYVAYGHFGNSHVHLNMLPKDSNEFVKAEKLYYRICSEAIKSGGTFSAEHGVGKNKTAFLLEMYGKENVERMKEIKRILDPNLILSRGNIFNF